MKINRLLDTVGICTEYVDARTVVSGVNGTVVYGTAPKIIGFRFFF